MYPFTFVSPVFAHVKYNEQSLGEACKGHRAKGKRPWQPTEIAKEEDDGASQASHASQASQAPHVLQIMLPPNVPSSSWLS